MLRISRRWLSLRFFTKDGCKLCSDADGVLTTTLKQFPQVPLEKIDITDPANQEWFDKYCFDVPVLHVERDGEAPVKFMHYFHEDKIAGELKR
ncbi:hypothetical protein DIURU_002621 [Diutina rugosa]|uniref:Glutaredoxin-like protein n=1 Tax=Diutina rugosa TaxID=5481 RepID=A0A642UVL8_DIURU|nr:uncharacterized protein DIURU_002621 [Diutina rugosa]KAA8902725.1 hypothetical protein DIURU_002621 [Diutina rugosa]